MKVRLLLAFLASLALFTLPAAAEDEKPLPERIAAAEFIVASYGTFLWDAKDSIVIGYHDDQQPPLFQLIFGSRAKKGQESPLGIWLIDPAKGKDQGQGELIEPGSPLEASLIRLMERSLNKDQNGNIRGSLLLLRHRPDRYQAMKGELRMKPYSVAPSPSPGN